MFEHRIDEVRLVHTGSGTNSRPMKCSRTSRPRAIIASVRLGSSPCSAKWAMRLRRSATAVVTAAGDILADSAGYLHGQARGAALSLAGSLGQRPAAEHLLVALIDQGTAEVLDTLHRAGPAGDTASGVPADTIGHHARAAT
jgi:hypothetical protein